MKRIIALILTAVLLLSITGCGPVATVQTDKTKTTLVVGITSGGVGTQWLKNAISAFEEKYKDYSFEEGKKGVQVVIGTSNRTTMLGDTLETLLLTPEMKDEVFFVDSAFYSTYVKKGLVYDLTDMVNEPLTEYGENESVLDKLDENIKDNLTIDGKIYALPYWQSSYCLVYNATLFDKNNWYFDANGGFTNASGNLGTGPDGEKGTWDDGMPRTYDEFFQLLDQIEKDNCTPFQMPGASGDYFSWLISQMAADVMGYDDFMLNFNFDGVATLIKDGTINWDNMTFETEEVTITPENGYELSRQPGLAYVLDFAQRLLQNTSYYEPNNSLSGSFKISQSQLEFIRNTTMSSKKNVAIMLDGIWWENEAEASFRETYGSNATKFDSTSEYKWMPLPKATEELVGSDSLAVNVLSSYCFIKSNIAPEKVEVAKEFLQFVHTDAMLENFTVITGIPRAFDYDVDTSDLTPFAQSMMQYYENSTKAFPMSNSALYTANPKEFWTARWLRSKYADDQIPYEIITSPLTEQTANGYRYTAEDLYEGILKYREETRWPTYASLFK